MRHFKALVFSVAVAGVFTHPVFAQTLPAGVTPQMMQQFQSMSPAQQQALAKQYGIGLPASNTTLDESAYELGAVGEPLQQPDFEEMSQESITDEDDTEAKLSMRFGLSLFDQEVSTFAPTDNAPVPVNYRLGVGDQLVVQLFGKENDQLTLGVDRNGDVVFPRLGLMTLAGLTFDDARQLIKTRVTQQLIGVDAVVSMGRLRAIGIFIAGEVRVPGAYSVSALTTVTQALFQAGGITEIGTLRNIQVLRQGVTVANFDVYNLLLRGDAANDIRLQSGDVVLVPPYIGIAEVVGEVKRPMIYEIKEGETIADLLSMAGSFSARAYPKLSILTRLATNGALPTVKSLNLYDPETLKGPVFDGDNLKVAATGDARSNIVTLTGAVVREGEFGWHPDLRVSDIITNARADLPREADLSFAVIVSYKNRLLDIEVKQFNLLNAIESPGSSADPVLREFDRILIFSQPQLEAEEGAGYSEIDDPNRSISIEADSGNGRQQRSAATNHNNSSNNSNSSDASLAGGEVDVVVANTRERLLAPVVRKLISQARENQPSQVISISGAVQAPGMYPLFEGSTVAGLIAAAGGVLDSAYLLSAELRHIRQQDNGTMETDYREIDLISAFDNPSQYLLSSRDHVTVRNIPDWNPTESMTITGEVEFPGEYLIQPGETLADVVKRAGGFTPDAFVSGAIFTRVEVAKREADRAQAFSRQIRTTYASRLLTEETPNSTLQEIVEVTETLDQFEGKGRLLIDLPLALAGDTAANLEVENGDVLVIPVYNPTVTVVGEVLEARSHSYDSNYGVSDYIGLSAGLTVRADDSAIYVVKANGSVAQLNNNWWRFDGSKAQVEPGDTVIVPINNQYRDTLTNWKEITAILYQGLVSVAVVAGL